MSNPPSDLEARQPAIDTLLRRARQLRGRAGRARAGSHDRKRCVGQALWLASFAQTVATDARLQTDWNAGWRDLAVAIAAHIRKTEKLPK